MKEGEKKMKLDKSWIVDESKVFDLFFFPAFITFPTSLA